MAIRTATLRSEVERHRASGGAGLVSHRVQGPRVLPALGEYATGIAAFAKGVFDVGQGVREGGKAMRSINGKVGQMKARNNEVDAFNFNQASRAENDPAIQNAMRNDDFEKAEAIQREKYPFRSRVSFGSYW